MQNCAFSFVASKYLNLTQFILVCKTSIMCDTLHTVALPSQMKMLKY